MSNPWVSRWVNLCAFPALVIALAAAAPSALAGNAGAAKSRVTQAKSNLDDGRIDMADDALDQAEKFLDGLGDDEKGPIEKDIKALREKLDTTRKAQESERVERNVNRTLDFADQ